jgi:hypothetical protein
VAIGSLGAHRRATLHRWPSPLVFYSSKPPSSNHTNRTLLSAFFLGERDVISKLGSSNLQVLSPSLPHYMKAKGPNVFAS